MFRFRETYAVKGACVQVAFTDASVDLQGLRPDFPAELRRVEEAVGVRFARMHQVHGADTALVSAPSPGEHTPDLDEVDALVTTRPGVGLMVRVADCVPVLLADVQQGVVAAAHAGRRGVHHAVVTATIKAMRDSGAEDIRAWIGPHVCGACYEVPAELQREVVEVVAEAESLTRAGTAALDLGAGVEAQLTAGGVADIVVTGGCTLEDADLHSYRRDGADSGRQAGLIWVSS